MKNTKDCKFCDKEGLLWLPLRYSATSTAQLDKLSKLPALTGKVGKGVTDLTLSQSKYSIRLLRRGYLYVLIERKGIKYWDAYAVLADSYLYKFDPATPPESAPKFTCDRQVCGMNASMVAIPNAKDVAKVSILFAPSPLTPAKLAEYKKNAAAFVAKGKMQSFSPASWLAGNTAQDHTLVAAEVMSKVVEYIILTEPYTGKVSDFGNIMQQQLFPAIREVYGSTISEQTGDYIGRFGSLYRQMTNAKSAAVVLFDHIGITQELNNFRNQAFDQVHNFMAATDKRGVSNERKFAVHQEINATKNAIEKNYIISVQGDMDAINVWGDRRHKTILEDARHLRIQGKIKEAEVVETEIAKDRAVRDRNYKEMLAEAKRHSATIWPNKYGILLNTSEMDQFKREADAIVDKCKALAKTREDDHLKWLAASRLIDSFDTFDPKHPQSGFCFSSHAHSCYFGMDSLKKSEIALDKWITASTIDRSNLFLRGYIYNQEAMVVVANKSIADARAAASASPNAGNINWQLATKGAKSLIDYLKKADSAWDEWARKGPDGKAGNAWQVEGFGEKNEGKLLSKCSSMTRSIFRLGMGNAGDKFIVAQLGALLYPKLGALAENIRLEQLMYRIDPEYPFPVTETATPGKGPGKERKLQRGSVANIDAFDTPRNINMDAARVKAAGVRESVQKALADALANPENSNYHQIRMGTILSGLEAVNLALQMPALFKSGKVTLDDQLKVIGASLALASTAFDMAYMGAKVVREQADWLHARGEINSRTRSSLRGAGEFARGGFKLASGFLSCGAGSIGAYLDWASAKDSKNKKEYILATIYGARTFVGLGSALLGVVAAYSYSGLFLTRIAIKYSGNRAVKAAIFSMGMKAAQFAARVRLLTMVARLNLAGLALTGSEIVYRICFDDNETEKWCKMSVFRKDKSIRGFKSAEDELEGLQSVYR